MPLPEGAAVKGVVGADQVKSLDWQARKASRIGAVPEGVVTEVMLRLRTLLDKDSLCLQFAAAGGR
jgi:mRNA interferase MazF